MSQPSNFGLEATCTLHTFWEKARSGSYGGLTVSSLGKSSFSQTRFGPFKKAHAHGHGNKSFFSMLEWKELHRPDTFGDVTGGVVSPVLCSATGKHLAKDKSHIQFKHSLGHF